ncbi:hypothetical protein, partial [Pseudomonas syringae]|uniref:hypothetical protein n=2 Tax=Pseudomonas syringae TaxID=317 RepID=UPI001E63893D
YQFHHLGSIDRHQPVDGAHYTERLLGCKARQCKKTEKNRGRRVSGVSAGSRRLFVQWIEREISRFMRSMPN